MFPINLNQHALDESEIALRTIRLQLGSGKVLNGPTLRPLRESALQFAIQDDARVQFGRDRPPASSLKDLKILQFDKILRNAGIFCTMREVESIARRYNNKDPESSDVRDKSCDIYQVFDALVLREMPKTREIMVEKLCNIIFNNNKIKGIDLSDFVQAVNVSQFPRAKDATFTVEDTRNRLFADLECIMQSYPSTSSSSEDSGPITQVTREVLSNYLCEVHSTTQCDWQFEDFCSALNQKMIEESVSGSTKKTEKLMNVVDLFVRKFNEKLKSRAVISTFKYHDANGEGSLSYDAFRDMCVSMGINVSDEEKRAVFCFFGKTGRVEEKTFVRYLKYLMELESTKIGQPSDYSTIKSNGPLLHDPDAKPVQLCKKIRDHLIKYHPRGLSIVFNILHSLNRTGSLTNASEFRWGLNVCGLRLGSAEMEYLVRYFSGGTQSVNKDEFLDFMRGPDMKKYEAREKIVRERISIVAPGPNEYNDSDYKMKKWEPAFGGGTFVAAQFILDKYCVTHHPAILKLSSTTSKLDSSIIEAEEKLRNECFDYLGESLSIGRASKAKLIRYITDESCTFTDEEFNDYLFTCFPSRNPDVEDAAYRAGKEDAAARGSKGI